MKNLALHKPAFQSSNFSEASLAGNAVDGTRKSVDDATFAQNCIHTGYDNPPWWAVDLRLNAVVFKVISYYKRSCNIQIKHV